VENLWKNRRSSGKLPTGLFIHLRPQVKPMSACGKVEILLSNIAIKVFKRILLPLPL
jgi:hypothetical protein